MTTIELGAEAVLPPPDGVAAAISALAGRDVRAVDLLGVLGADQRTGEVLRIVTSVIRSGDPPASAIAAVQRLGGWAPMLTLSAALHASLLEAQRADVHIDRLARRGLFAAVAANSMARHVGVDGGVAVAAALCQDIGVPLLERLHPARYAQVYGTHGHHDLVLAEVEHLGVDHAAAGAALMESWGAPSELVSAVSASHAIDPIDARGRAGAADVVAVSGGIADIFLGGRDRLAEASWAANRLVDMSTDDFASVVSQVAQSVVTLAGLRRSKDPLSPIVHDLCDASAVRRRLYGTATHDLLLDRPSRTSHVAAELRREGHLDPATHLVSLPVARELLQHELDRSDQLHTPCAVLLVGLGDAAPPAPSVVRDVLRQVATGVRHDDLLARWDATSALLMLPGSTPPDARRVAERVLRAARTVVVDGVDQPTDVPVSVGIAAHTAERSYESVDEMLVDADLAMFQAQVNVGHRWEIQRPGRRRSR